MAHDSNEEILREHCAAGFSQEISRDLKTKSKESPIKEASMSPVTKLLSSSLAVTALSISTLTFAAGPETKVDPKAKTSDVKVEIKSDVQKASYAIGQQIGQNMKAQGIAVDVDVLAVSLKDALNGTPSRMTEDDMRASLQKLQTQAQDKMKLEAKKNKEEGDKFLAANKKKKGIESTKSGLQYEVVKKGTGKLPSAESKVKVHYSGTLIDGKEFDSSYARNTPAEFKVGEVIPGWTEALKLMSVGSKWNLTIPSDLAYGEMGRPGKIPPNSVLKFTVELIAIVP